MAKLTKKQLELLQFIVNYGTENPYPPTIREIATTFEISPSTATERVDRLVRKGYLHREFRVARGIWVTEKIEQLGTE